MTTKDLRSLIDTLSLLESEQIDEFNWRKPLAAAITAGKLMGDASAETDYSEFTKPPAAVQTIGSTYPVFFDKYSVQKVDDLSEKLNNGDISSITVTYDEDYELAKRIAKNISVLTGTDIKIKHDPQIDTDTTQYNHSGVVAIVNSK